ncbi:MAG: IS66 family transposase [Bacteroidales bacterium]|nr:IS66 family transposase [Bacteroidales bacterium]
MTVEEQLKAKDERIESLERRVERLMQTIELLQKRLFGRTSEKHPQLDPNQLDLFGPEQTPAPEKTEPSEKTLREEEEIAKSIRPKSRPARKPIDTSSLPVEVVDIYPEGTTDEMGGLKEDYEELAPEVTDRLERVPAKVYVVRVVRHRVMRKSDRKKNPEDRSILIAPLPPTPIFKCIAGASVLAGIIIDKFLYHLPFYRQIQQLRECGVSISDSTIGGWFGAAVLLLKPLYDLLKRKLLSSGYIQVDESVIPVLDDEKHKARKGYLWCLRDDGTGEVVFHYDQGRRTKDVAQRLLEDYHGVVQCDGYKSYSQFENSDNIVLANCWIHARRKFYDALEENRALATQAINYISRLYKVEAEADAAGLSAEERRLKRERESAPVIEAFREWLLTERKGISAQSRIGKAIIYARSHITGLSQYVHDGKISIDNNGIENAIRPLAIGRKNYLFCSNEASAHRAAIAYSLIGTCKAVGVDPRAWMEDVLMKIPYYEQKGKDMTELLPANWVKLGKTDAE